MCDYVVCVEVQELWLRNSGGLGYFTLCGFTYGFTQTALERQCGQCEGRRAAALRVRTPPLWAGTGLERALKLRTHPHNHICT